MSSDLRRGLRLFYVFRLLATSYLYIPIFMLFRESRGLSFGEAISLGGIFAGVVILVEVPTGVFADRIGRRRSMLLGALTMVASCLLAARATSFGELVIAESLAALSLALCSGADSAYLFDLLRAADRTEDYARHESVASFFHLVGCAAAFAGGGALAEIDLALPYLATAGVAGVAAIVACLMYDDKPAPAEQRAFGAWSAQIVDALAYVGKNPRLAWMVGYCAVVFVLLRATDFLYQPYLKANGLGPAAIGLLFAGVYTVAALVAFRTHLVRARIGDELLLWGLLGVLATSFLGLAGVHAGPWMLALLVVQAIANGIYSPLTKPLLNAEIADSRRRAAVLSVESMARRAAMGVFAPLVGLWGASDVMLLCGAVGLGGLLLLALARRPQAEVVTAASEMGD